MLREDFNYLPNLLFFVFTSTEIVYKKAGKSTYFSRTRILRDVPKFIGEQAHWVDYKGKPDDVLFFHSSTLQDILRGKRG